MLRACYSLGARLAELVAQVRPYRRPFARDDAVDARVAQRAVACALVTAQDAVELGADALDGATARGVEEMCPELHGDAVERLEGMLEQHQLALRIEWRALHPLAIPGG